jgi:dUTP pyrophosphatase
MSDEIRIHVAVVRSSGPGAPLPSYQTDGAAGLDLPAALSDPVTIAPGTRALIGTGWIIAIPPGFEGQVRPRSGLALRHGITVLNSPGTIDSDYRGEVRVVLMNHGDAAFTVRPGDRIAQLVIAPVVRATLSVADSLDRTGRGEGGYGSTGSGSG